MQPDYVRREILPEFFRSFWVRRMALDRRNYRALVETTVALANKVGALPAGASPTLTSQTRFHMTCPSSLLKSQHTNVLLRSQLSSSL